MKVKTAAIVSLSDGMLGEDFVRYQYERGVKRLHDYGLNVKIMKNALRGIEYLENNPDKRADDLLQAFGDDEVDMILCAIGGDDTYRLAPYLFAGGRLRQAIRPKIFLGFSDTTVNHFMLHKLGLKTFYGQAFLPDICELDSTMLPYTASFFKELIETGGIAEIKPAEKWYEERADFSARSLGTQTRAHTNQGFELLRGEGSFSGEILGGCLESIYNMLTASRYPDSAEICGRYQLFPQAEEWRGKILLLETSEEKTPAPLFEQMLNVLKNTGIFETITGVMVGKPMDEAYYEEYKAVLLKVIDREELPILYNVNVGHARPRCIVPFGQRAEVDAGRQRIRFAK